MKLRVDRRGARRSMQTPVKLEPDRKRQLTECVVQFVRDPNALAHTYRLGRLSVQARVLEREGRVVGRRAKHLELLGLEYTAGAVADRQDSNRNVVVQERDCEHGADRGLARVALGGRQRGVRRKVRGCDQAPLSQRPSLDRTELRRGEVVVDPSPIRARDGDEPRAAARQLVQRGASATEQKDKGVDDLAAERRHVERA